MTQADMVTPVLWGFISGVMVMAAIVVYRVFFKTIFRKWYDGKN